MIKSKALEVNIADHHVDVAIDERYTPMLAVMSKYYGLMEGVSVFLKELSHPYKNWHFIVSEARTYALDYFHLARSHEQGVAAVEILVGVFLEAIEADTPRRVKAEAADNLLLYLQKIIKEIDPAQDTFITLLDGVFERLTTYPDSEFFLFVKSYYQIKRLAGAFLERMAPAVSDCRTLYRLTHRYLTATYRYWQVEGDPYRWFKEEIDAVEKAASVQTFFAPIELATIRTLQERLIEIDAIPGHDRRAATTKLLELPVYGDFVEVYRRIPQQLLKAAPNQGIGNRWKIIFLFHIMNIKGLSQIHEEALRDINRTVSWLIDNASHRYIRSLIEKTFSILAKRTSRYPATALTCILNMGKGVYRTDEIDLVNFFIDRVIQLGFQAPMVGGVDDDWQIRVNAAHLQNIRTWMELIELNPKFSIRLISNLIIHLSISGVFIKDTDLFPRDITRFLNSDIGRVYNQAKQLCRIFPVYFNDIGAEGRLREISTRIDELSHRRDPLIHFLRKQSHVESSNRILAFMEATLHFWTTRDKGQLQPYLPPTIYTLIETQGPFVDGVHAIMKEMETAGVDLPVELLEMDPAKIRTSTRDAVDATDFAADTDRERVELIIQFYQLLNQKYNLDFLQIQGHMDQLRSEALPDLNKLSQALAHPKLKTRLFLLLEYLDRLKGVILSSEQYAVREDIYKKRHFTVDIPSMYGSYHEMKFDALGLTFRIEALVNVLFEQLIEDIDLSLITKATFADIYDRLVLFDKALKLDGITSIELERQLDLLAHSLEVRGFTFTQYLDIFKGFAQAVKNIINDHFNNIHGTNLTRILFGLPIEEILPKYVGNNGLDAGDREKLTHRVSEVFFRDRIAASLGLQQLDLFLSRIMSTLFHQSNKLPKDKLHRLLNYDPKRAMTSIVEANNNATGIIYLGNKGLNLMKLRNFGLPVPPGFIITTEAFRCREIIDGFLPAQQNFTEQVAHQIALLERTSGKRFGDPRNPLLLSVRSGASISQPGMMDTFLDVGVNAEIAEGLAAKTGNPWFAWDNYRRFIQCTGMAYGMERDDFDAIISEFKRKLGIPLKRGFSGKQMKQMALAYRERVEGEGYPVPENPIDQLHKTIQLVFASWESEKARTYRHIMGISDDWGTAVTVQEMVFGNLGQNSGTGVIFTHNPRWSGDSLNLWGDFTIGNQGEDVVSGLVATLPISIKQQDIEMRETDITLESHFPEIYQAMKAWANLLIYRKGWSPQEIEFTFEQPKVESIYVLQTRDMAIRERKRVLTFAIPEKQKARLLGNGIGVSGGAMSGRVVFNLEEIDRWRQREPNCSLILLRSDTVPDDIKEIHAADGLLTARGGVTSHASVVAHRLGKTCVVGCADLVCNERKSRGQFYDKLVRSGDYISIDGRGGAVYQGLMGIDET
jgi:pyruvate,orthophosphate dikinase